MFLLRRIPYWLVLVKRILFSMGKNKYSSDKNLKYTSFFLKGTLNLGRTSTAWERRIWTSKFSFEGTWIFQEEFNLCSKELNLRVRWEWPNRNVCPSEKYNDDWKRIQWLLTIVLGRKLPRTIYHQWNVWRKFRDECLLFTYIGEVPHIHLKNHPSRILWDL